MSDVPAYFRLTSAGTPCPQLQHPHCTATPYSAHTPTCTHATSRCSFEHRCDKPQAPNEDTTSTPDPAHLSNGEQSCYLTGNSTITAVKTPAPSYQLLQRRHTMKDSALHLHANGLPILPGCYDHHHHIQEYELAGIPFSRFYCLLFNGSLIFSFLILETSYCGALNTANIHLLRFQIPSST